MNLMLFTLIGFAGGFVGGALGLGGGAVMVPLLVMVAGLSQHQAQGQVVGLLTVPVFFLAAYRYYIEGNLDLKITGLMILGFVAGSFLGAHLIQYLPGATLKKIFAVALMLIGLKILLGK